MTAGRSAGGGSRPTASGGRPRDGGPAKTVSTPAAERRNKCTVQVRGLDAFFGKAQGTGSEGVPCRMTTRSGLGLALVGMLLLGQRPDRPGTGGQEGAGTGSWHPPPETVPPDGDDRARRRGDPTRTTTEPDENGRPGRHRRDRRHDAHRAPLLPSTSALAPRADPGGDPDGGTEQARHDDDHLATAPLASPDHDKHSLAGLDVGRRGWSDPASAQTFTLAALPIAAASPVPGPRNARTSCRPPRRLPQRGRGAQKAQLPSDGVGTVGGSWCSASAR